MTRPSTADTRPPAIRTFVIADIRGYTTFTADYGDEAASRLAAKFAEIATQGVEAWGGQLVELRGDEALAVFDSARQALRAALELQAAFAAETLAEPELPLRVGIGMDAGEAVAVGDGYRGGALNRASRLCALAAAGEAIASENVAQLAGAIRGISYVQLDPTELKGLRKPVPAVRLANERAEPIQEHVATAGGDTDTATISAPLKASVSLLPPELDPIVPLAGRLTELRWLGWHWRRACHGAGRAVAMSGPPGMGKTRLAAELARTVHAGGATAAYLPAGHGIQALSGGESASSAAPALVIVDDFDAATAADRKAVVEFVGGLDGSHTLLLLTHRLEAEPSLLKLVDRLGPPEQRRRLEPLELEDVRSISALYTGRAVDKLPLEDLLEESAGLPAAIHQLASAWARRWAEERLNASVRSTSVGLRGLRTSQSELIDSVVDLELARERIDLYKTDGDDDGAAARVDVCPYKGLAAFEAADAEYFFGRDRLVAELVARLVGTSFLGILGASGSGKSSALRAGLLPALAGGVLPGSDHWRQILMRPGDHPMTELARVLGQATAGGPPSDSDVIGALDAARTSLPTDARLVLVVDQFEELFNATRDEEERRAFVKLLTSERSGLKVVVAMRADHYGHCAAHSELAAALGSNQVLVGPLTRPELEAVIEHPAQRVGLRVEPGLSEALLDDVGDEPGALPLLSTALLELWQARRNRSLTLAAYKASGGVRGAVARLAEAAYAQLDETQQPIARSLLLRLAGPGEGEGVVRRRVMLSELDAQDDPAIAAVLDRLTAARLLTTGDGYVEVAHEALLREWPRLQAWLAEDAAGRQLRLHLIDAARDWHGRGREAGDLYRGARLAAALDWLPTHEHELNALEREFLQESRLASEREVEGQRRVNRRLRLLLAGAGVFLLVAIGAGVFAAYQAQVAAQAEQIARSRELAASAIAALDDDPTLSKLLALSAASIADPPIESLSALHQAWAADRVVYRYTWPSDRELYQLWTDLDPSGRFIVASGSEGAPSTYLEVFDLSSGNVSWSYEVPPSVVIDAPVFAQEGAVVVAGVTWDASGGASQRDEARDLLGAFIWDARTGELLERFDLGACGGWVNGISDTYLLVRTVPAEPEGCFQSADVEMTVELLDRRSAQREVLASNPGNSGPAALSGDGRYVAFDDEGDVIVLDLSTRSRNFLFDAFDTEQMDKYVRALNHDGSLLLYGGRPVQVWDVALGEVAASYDGHAGESWFADFGPTGLTVYSTGRDGSLRHWDARTGEELASVPSVGNRTATAVADGRVLVANSETRAALMVDAGVRGEVDGIATCTGFVAAGSLAVAGNIAAFSPVCERDTNGITVEDKNGSTVVVDLEQGKVLYSLAGHEGQTLSISPDGLRFVRQEGSGTVLGSLVVHDLRTGAEILVLEGLCEWDFELLATLTRVETGECEAFPNPPFPILVWQLRWSPDGSMIAAVDQGGFDGFLAVWDAETGELIHTRARDVNLGFGPNDMIFTPDSQGLIVGHGGKGARQRISTETWEVLAEVLEDQSLEGGDRLGFIGMAPDGTLAGVGGYAGLGAGALHWFDTDTLEAQRDRTKPQIHEGAIKSVAISPDGSLLATGAADGFVRVWDARTGTLEHEIPFGPTQVQGVAFITNSHLAVTPQEGNVFVVTIDTAELLEIVRDSLTRGFTTTECGKFNFGEACPSLEQLRGD